MESPIWKPGTTLIVLLLFSCLFSVKSVVQNSKGVSNLQKNKAIGQASTKNTKSSLQASAKSRTINPRTIVKPRTTTPRQNLAELEKREFLTAHNKIRFLHGEPPFTWDPRLMLYAQQYFVQRYNDCDMIHSDGPYGENIFWGSGKKWKASDAVRNWAGENKFYNGGSRTCYPGKMCGHYTQIVWRDSVRLGCVRSYCKNGGTYIICEYDPPGNYFGENPFEIHNSK